MAVQWLRFCNGDLDAVTAKLARLKALDDEIRAIVESFEGGFNFSLFSLVQQMNTAFEREIDEVIARGDNPNDSD